jgi:hypothetical protein
VQRRWTPRRFVGCFFLWTSGMHVGIVAADTSFYRDFAGGAVLPWVERAWRDVFMANPAAWGLAVAAGELTLGLLLLKGGRAARLGWLGVIAFHIGLVLFGWGFLLWSVPALAFLIPFAVRDWGRLEPPNANRAERRTLRGLGSRS